MCNVFVQLRGWRSRVDARRIYVVGCLEYYLSRGHLRCWKIQTWIRREERRIWQCWTIRVLTSTQCGKKRLIRTILIELIPKDSVCRYCIKLDSTVWPDQVHHYSKLNRGLPHSAPPSSSRNIASWQRRTILALYLLSFVHHAASYLAANQLPRQLVSFTGGQTCPCVESD